MRACRAWMHVQKGTRRLEVVLQERGERGEEGGLLMKKVENERDRDGGNDGARRREKEGNGEATGRTGRRGGQTADNLAFIMCHRAVLVQHLHSHTRWI